MKLFLLVTPLLLAAGAAFALDGDDQKRAQAEAAVASASTVGAAANVIAAELPSYPFTQCLVSDEPLENPIDHVEDGHLYRLCCKGCVRGIKADPAAFRKRVEEAVIAAQKPHWPVRSCPVSDEPYGGEMGEPVSYVHGTRYVEFCCKGCVRGFQRDPAKYMQRIDAVYIETQRKSYPLETCVVGGDELVDGEAVEFLYGTQLVRLCCKGCVAPFRKEAARYLPKIRAARE